LDVPSEQLLKLKRKYVSCEGAKREWMRFISQMNSDALSAMGDSSCFGTGLRWQRK